MMNAGIQDLGERIDAARAGDLLKPVTIICGPHAREDVMAALAASEPALNIRVLPLNAYVRERARELAPKELLDRRRIGLEVVRILSAGGTAFTDAYIADEPATRIAVTEAVGKLLGLPREWRGRVGNRKLPKVILDIAEQVELHSAERYFTLAEARMHAASPDGTIRLGAGVMAEDAVEAQLLDKMGIMPLEVEPMRRNVEMRSYTTPHAEITEIARRIRAALTKEVPPQRIAVAYCNPTYLPLIVRIFDQAGLQFSAAATRNWSEDAVIRTFVALLRVGPDTLNRRQLAAALSAGRIGAEGVNLWEFDWFTRGIHAISQARDWEVAPESPITAWVRTLRDDLARIHDASTWRELAECLNDLVDGHLKSVDKQSARALRFLRSTVQEIGQLDGLIHRAPEITLLHEFLDEAFAEPQLTEHTGPIVVADLASLGGRNLELAFICGALDGALPGRFPQDPCITEQQLNADATDWLRRREQQFSAANSSAARVCISYSRSVLDNKTAQQPSAWLKLTEDQANRKKTPELHDLGVISRLTESGAQNVTPISETEAEFLLHGTSTDIDETFSTILAARSAAVGPDHLGAEFNGFINPEIAVELGRSYIADHQLSASSLESYLDSPLIFFIERILGKKVLEDPDIGDEIDSRQQGDIYHRIFENWTRKVWLDAEPKPCDETDIDWARAQQILLEITQHELEAAASGRYSGVTWDIFCEQVHQTVDDWFRQEHADAKTGWIPVAVEHQFGRDFQTGEQSPTLSLEINEATISFVGSIDRIDVNLNDRELRLTDYKSGKAKDTKKKVTSEHPIGSAEAGWKLQLSLYGEVIRTCLEGESDISPAIAELAMEEDTPITTRYYFFRKLDGISDVSTPFDEETRRLFRAAVTEIHRLICNGFFPAKHDSRSGFFGDSARKIRMGAANFNALATAMQTRGLVPLQILDAPHGIAQEMEK